MPFNIQAALGLGQFERIEELVSIKRHHYNFYKDELKNLKLQLNYEPPNVLNSAWITSIVLDKSYNINKSLFIEKMQKIGIPSRPFFYPLSSIPAFKEFKKVDNPNSYDISNRGVNLPGAANLTDDQLFLICNSIKKVLND